MSESGDWLKIARLREKVKMSLRDFIDMMNGRSVSESLRREQRPLQEKALKIADDLQARGEPPLDESSQMAFWGAAVDRGLATQADYDRASEVYGSMFSYSGD
jgi:hypothetical protein